MTDPTPAAAPAPRVPPPAADTDDPTELVGLLAVLPGVVPRLRAAHVDNGSGRCTVCPIGPQAGQQRWPCQLRWLADRAQELIDRQELADRRARPDTRRGGAR